jgi:hypothetical protein
MKYILVAIVAFMSYVWHASAAEECKLEGDMGFNDILFR